MNRGSEFTHMRVGPVGYHNKMRQLESTCDRRLMAVLTSTTPFVSLEMCLHGTENLFILFSRLSQAVGSDCHVSF